MRRDASLLGSLIATFYAFWLVQVVLRLFSLGRLDAYGFPAVNKFDWYIFHAVAFDWLWYLPFLLPLFVAWLAGAKAHRGVGRSLLWLTRGLFTLLLLLTVIDQELFRFMSIHFSRSMIETYGNASSVREIFQMIGADQSVPWLPIVLFFAAPTLYFILDRLLMRWLRVAPSLARHGMAIGVVTLLFWSYTQWIWGGTFRERRLAPVVKVLLFSSEEERVVLNEEERNRLVAEYQQEWMAIEGDSLWVFVGEEYPYLRMRFQEWCQREGVEEPRCQIDGDGDGVVLADDLDDWNSEVGAASNAEETEEFKRPNFILAILESQRAVNSGLYAGAGSWESATPLLDSLGALGEVWNRFNVGGMPTVGALASIHLGIPEYPLRHIISTMPQLSAQSFVELLRNAGYATHFFSSADPAWDNQVPWLNRWYDRWHYDRSREEDAKMLRHAAHWAVDSLDRSRPFLLTLMTKTNHYPFNWVEGMEPYSGELNLQERMVRTMRYTEESLRAALHKLDSAGLLHNTIIVLLGDHGFSLGLRPEEHNNGTIGSGLYSEQSWIPLVIAGNHPRIRSGVRHHQPANQADLAPTLIDLAGIAPTNHFTGHSLFRPSTERGVSYTFYGDEGLMENEEWRVHGSWNNREREQGEEIFDAVADRNELRDLSDEKRALRDSLLNVMRKRATLHAWVVEQNRLWQNESPFAAGK